MPDTNSTGSSGVPMNNRKVPINPRAAARRNLLAGEASALSEGRGFRANIDAGDWVDAPIDDDYDDFEDDAVDSLDEEIPDSGNSMAGSEAMNRAPDDDSYDEYFDDDGPMFGLDEDAGENDNTPWRKKSSDDEGEDSKDASNNRSAKDGGKKANDGNGSGDESGKKKSKSLPGGSDSSKDGSSAKKANDAERGGFYKPSGDKGAREGGKAEKAVAVAGAAAEAAGVKGAGKISGFKKKGPIMAILALLGGLGFGISSSQLLMPFHVVQELTQMFDSTFTTKHARSATMLKKMFNLDNQDIAITTRFKKNKYRIKPNSKIAKKLEVQGIKVTKGSSGKTVLTHKGVEIDADDFSDMYRNNKEFRNDFNRGTRTITGRIAGYIDLTIARFLDNFNLTRNLFKTWINDVYAAEGKTTKFHEIIRGEYPDSAVRAQGHIEDDVDDGVDSEGNKKTKTVEENRGDSDAKSTKTGDAAELAESIVNVASLAVSAVCAYGTVSATLAAIKTATALDQARRYFSNIAEAVDKTKYGNGEKAPLYQVAFDLSEQKNGLSALTSEGMKMVISQGEYSPDLNNDYVKLMNVQETFKTFFSSIKFVIGCAVATAVTSLVSVAIDAMTVGTFSVGKALFGVAAGVAMAGVSDMVMKELTKYATTELCPGINASGRGECTVLGAYSWQAAQAMGSGSTPGSQAMVEQHYEAHQLSLADEAEYDRATRSPFDITNSNTFLGSIVGKLSIIGSTLTGSSVLNSLSNLASSSLSSLLPTASAYDKVRYLNSQKGNCEGGVSDINALGNLYCMPFIINDMSYVGTDPDQNLKSLDDRHQFEEEADGSLKLDEDGNEIIKPDSLTGKFISFCANRTSPFGTMDANIAAQIQKYGTSNSGNEALDTVLNNVINNIPVVSGVFDAVNNISVVNNAGWISGANCVARESGDTLDVEYQDRDKSFKTQTLNLVDWNDLKASQLYVVDDRYMQNTDDDYASPVISYLERQEAENPSDGTYAEWLAKQTGILKEDVQVALNKEAYWYYVAQYNPEGKGPIFDNEIKPEADYQMPENEITNDYNERISAIKAWVVYTDNRIQEVTA